MTTEQKRDRYVYGLPYEAGHPDYAGKPCYIGLGKGKRMHAHAWHARGNPEDRNRRLYQYLGDCHDRGVEIVPYKIASDLTIAEAATIEIALIKQYGRIEYGGCLLNLDKGGFGSGDRAPSTGQRISEKLKGKAAPHIGDSNRRRAGRSLTQEHKDKLRTILTGKKRTEETKEKIRQATTGITRTTESKAKQSASTKGVPKSPETRARMAAASRLREFQKRDGKPPAYFVRRSRLTDPRP